MSTLLGLFDNLPGLFHFLLGLFEFERATYSISCFDFSSTSRLFSASSCEAVRRLGATFSTLRFDFSASFNTPTQTLRLLRPRAVRIRSNDLIHERRLRLAAGRAADCAGAHKSVPMLYTATVRRRFVLRRHPRLSETHSTTRRNRPAQTSCLPRLQRFAHLRAAGSTPALDCSR